MIALVDRGHFSASCVVMNCCSQSGSQAECFPLLSTDFLKQSFPPEATSNIAKNSLDGPDTAKIQQMQPFEVAPNAIGNLVGINQSKCHAIVGQ